MPTEDDFPLSAEEVKGLLQLATQTYQKQAHACLQANAPLASCVMAGATVEAILSAVTCLLYDEALQTGKAPQKKGKTKKLLEWSFFELLDVAKEAKWLPEELTLDAKVDFRSIKTPVKTDSIREVRNLVHPARYLKDGSGKEYTHGELSTLQATCHAAYDCLINTICDRFPQFAYFKSS